MGHTDPHIGSILSHEMANLTRKRHHIAFAAKVLMMRHNPNLGFALPIEELLLNVRQEQVDAYEATVREAVEGNSQPVMMAEYEAGLNFLLAAEWIGDRCYDDAIEWMCENFTA